MSERVAPAANRTGRTIRIGVTGPIGCGKSQVVRWLAELGVRRRSTPMRSRGR